MTSSPPHRLPRNVAPERYRLEIAPDLDAGRFSGTVTVTLRVLEDTDRVVLNAADLDIGTASLTDATGSPVPLQARTAPEAEQLVADLARTLPAGSGAELRIDFAGTLDGGLRGFYRSSFRALDGTARTIASTQFEATDARRAFPCWDEPDRKAVFSVSIVAPADLTVLSCSPELAREDLGDGRVRVRFADTMPMSTYVLAWVLGPFELTDPVEVVGVPVRLAAPAGKKRLTSFGLDAAVHAIDFLSRYFDLPYPAEKLDHVAVPDFAFGAMENLGLVLYRESALLADTTSASHLELLRVAGVVAHETAHMWFGNLVTMRWWNGIWLNEAFATFMDLEAVAAFRPDWEPWSAQTARKAEALAIDGLPSTRPVEYEVISPEDADAMFDVLTYEKGASVLRMLQHFLGKETFRRGIATYLARHRHANTETTDLWDALEAESGQPVRSVMDSWIFQPGYPVVRIEPAADGSSVLLTQRPFRYLGDGAGQWAVPMSLRASVDGQIVRRRVLLDGDETVEFGGTVEWVVGNEEGTGYYRTSYHPALRPPLRTSPPACSAIERVHLLDDAWAEVVAESAPLRSFVELASGLEEERDPDVWRVVAEAMVTLDRIARPEQRPVLAAAVRRIGAGAFASLGWDPAPAESVRSATARARLVTLLGTVGADPDVQAEALARHRAFLTDGSGLSPDVRTAAVTVVAAIGGDDTYEELLACYRRADTPQDQVRYLSALGSFDDPELTARALGFALSEEVRVQDAPLLVARALAGRCGAEVTWPWIESAFDTIVARFPRNLLSRFVERLDTITDEETAMRVHHFLASHPIPLGGPKLAQIEQRLDVSVALAGRLRPTLADDLG
jgi:puromycin-sensitive aminopeptidase